MGRRMDWRRARGGVKPTLSLADEKEVRGRDRAAHFLQIYDAPLKPVKKKHKRKKK